MNWLLFIDAAFYIWIMVSAVWVLSLLVRNSGIMDIFWGMGFILVALTGLVQNDELSARVLIITALIIIWGLRLSLYIAIRSIGSPEDSRYQAWRQEAGAKWWWLSYFKVFLQQGIILLIISTPLQVAQNGASDLNIFDFMGIVIWTAGFLFEAVGDWQLTKFKSIPSNRGKVLMSGLWAYTRHPNYFGEALMWWGYFFIALGSGGWFTIFSPVIMTYLLVKVSGAALLDKLLLKTKPEYADYVKSVPSFIPRIGRKNSRL